MIDIIEDISKFRVKRKNLLDKPKGVRGRSSNNDLIRQKLGWDCKVVLKDGLKKTYDWIDNQIKNKPNNNKFTRKY